MSVPGTSQGIDEELYSRQLYVLGTAAMLRLQDTTVLVSGMRGLGAEIAKNLALAGVGSLTVHDPNPVRWTDLSSQFFLSEKDLGKNRAEVSQPHLAQLNSFVPIRIHTEPLTEAFLRGFQVVVLTDSTLEEQLWVGSFCHKHGVRFLVADARGLVGQLFCDFGEDFTIQDPTEAEPVSAPIQHISQGSPGLVTLCNGQPHDFQDGDWVTFSGIRGMMELNGCAPQPIHLLDEWTLEIGDTMTFTPYLSGGIVTEVKKPQICSYEPLHRALDQPRILASSPKANEEAHCLHQAFRALHHYEKQTGHPPRPWNLVEANEVVALTQKLTPQEQPLDDALVRKFALCCAGDLSPIDSILGGIAAQEVLKAASGKFRPLNQWLYINALECLPEDGEPPPSPEDCAPLDSRYDGQRAVFGTDFQKKLGRQCYFLVGAGAIGCELLKSFAMLGLGAGPGGGITVTDMDSIERSNLCRQFLFRPQDVSKPKAEVAAAAARQLNPRLAVTPHVHRVGPDTESIFGDDFFSGLHGVATALDNFEGRQYVADRCVHYLKPMLESGTQGTRGSAGVYLPFLTQRYRAPVVNTSPTFPVCTLRHFPSAIEHTLQWARDEFEGLFRQPAETVHRYLREPSFLETLEGAQALTLLESLYSSLTHRPQDWRDCVSWARRLWQLHYHDGIRQLLLHFPPEKMSQDGVPFWSGTKRCPQPLDFDHRNPTHLDYILAAANLYAQVYGLSGSKNRDALQALLRELSVPAFQPRADAQIFASDQEMEQQAPEDFSKNLGTEQEKRLQELRGALEKQQETFLHASPMKPLLFEKDDDSNFHMDFIVAASNLRAENYGIPPANRSKSKFITGQIIPAIATTTAVVAGLVCLELYKVVWGHQRLSSYRNNYLHLAEPRFSRYVPTAPVIQRYRHLEWTCWDRLTVPTPPPGQPEMTLQDLLDHIWAEHRLKVTMLLLGSAWLYSRGWPEAKRSRHLSQRVTELVRRVTGRALEPRSRVLVLEVGCEEEEEDATFPPLHYCLRE
ncbi:ubiquitin-like modifier-activating enzyme 7 isoform X1 [Ornithorhynchus anatinus]|uniref:ubiquitin-like modifier-activating enzyme 7 isoform X1 n=1 Tax=Ornithorhynchus anatinus TaxID=9258 RepID=UPI0010A7CFDF|nr:ubiquitin-like modifier-activating enzyme 7 isoform X1 [Ornithorhynchus anatinus]